MLNECSSSAYGSGMSETDGMLPPPPPPPSTPTAWTSEQLVRKETISPALRVWLQIVLYASGVCALLTGAYALAAGNAMEEYLETDSWRSYYDLVDADDVVGGFWAFGYLFSIAAFVLLIIFSFRAHKACSTIWIGPRKWSRGMTVGSWFIPLANFIITPMIWIESDRIANAPRDNGKALPGWENSPISKMAVTWWSLYAVGVTLIFAIPITGGEGFESENYYSSFMRVGAAGALLLGAASVLAALSVRRIGRALSPAEIG
jgi:hypothetical protein